METGSQRLLIFTVGDSRYALDLQEVAEVLPPQTVFPSPWTPGYLKGVINFHGGLVAVLDLAEFMKLETLAGEGSLLVLDRGIASLALAVDRVESIIAADAVLEEDEGGDLLTEKVMVLADGEVNKLSVMKLLETVEQVLKR